MALPEFVKIVDVGPRDGLQNEAKIVPLEAKVTLINRLSDAGVPVVEAGSFVSPKWVPQMSDTAEVMARITRRPGVRYPVLVPNMKGLDAAKSANAGDIAVFAAASEAFSQKNINCSIAESLERFRPVVENALKSGIDARGYISCVLGCPYEGEVAPAKVVEVARALFDMGCSELSLGDTIGVGTPLKAREMILSVAEVVPLERIAVHFHDTYGQALSNIFVCLQEGVSIVDTSVAGLGGCPYAKGASGNVSTEDVVYMLQGMGLKTGIDLDKLVGAASFISGVLGRIPASNVTKAKS